MKKEYFTMDDFDFFSEITLIRVDINCPFNEQTGQIEDSDRILGHAQTIMDLSAKKAKVVILAHQGRKGEPDFIPLKQHAALLTKHIGKTVEYVDDLYGPKALARIKNMQNGAILLLENTRMYEDETKKQVKIEDYAKTQFVQTLSSVSKFFVNDAFSAAHRAQASLVGFPQTLPSAAGRVMQKELEGLQRALNYAEHPNIYILGGAKPDDVYLLLKFACSSDAVDKILTSGVLGELCLSAKGIDLGLEKQDYFRKNGFDALLPELKMLISQYPTKIEMPSDVAVEENGMRAEYSITEVASKANGKLTGDIGQKTISAYSQIITGSKTLYFKGPVGIYENPLFENGTKTILQAIENCEAFKLMGGGHSLSAMEKFGINRDRISHISLAGGAVVEYLQGKKLPAVEALKDAYLRDHAKFENFAKS